MVCKLPDNCKKTANLRENKQIIICLPFSQNINFCIFQTEFSTIFGLTGEILAILGNSGPAKMLVHKTDKKQQKNWNTVFLKFTLETI